jgi:hypothetical protein
LTKKSSCLLAKKKKDSFRVGELLNATYRLAETHRKNIAAAFPLIPPGQQKPNRFYTPAPQKDN